MAYNKQKLLRFKESILRDVDLKISKMKENIIEFEHKELEAAKNKKLQETFTIMQEKIKKIKLENKQKIAKKELEIKNEILVYRNKLIAEIRKLCINRLLKFTDTPSYEIYLEKCIKKINNKFDLKGSTLLLKPSDLKYKEKMLSFANFNSVETDNENNIGGFKIILNDKKTLIDETLSNKFEVEFKNFRKNCKLALNISEMR